MTRRKRPKPGQREAEDAIAIKRALAGDLARAMKQAKMSQSELARRMRTSRAVVHRLLRRDDASITLSQLSRAAAVLGAEMGQPAGVTLGGKVPISIGPSRGAARDRRLGPDEIVALAVSVLGSEEIAETWLKTPSFSLGRRTPAQMLRNPTTAREVVQYLKRIMSGVYT